MNQSPVKEFFTSCYKNINFMVGAIMVLSVIIIAIFADQIAPYEYDAADPTSILLAPSGEHFFGTDNMGRDLFSRIVFGTRITLQVAIIGAGLILDGKLYTGTNDNAGELGHIRLSDFGPVGYGKSGSFEGFCSGGGIRQLAQARVKEQLQMGKTVAWCKDHDKEDISAKAVAEAAHNGDPVALGIYRTVSEYLGKGLAMVIDMINPEVIVIGSIYARNEQLMKANMEKILDKEALGLSRKVCRILPAELGEYIGDYAALSVAATIEN